MSKVNTNIWLTRDGREIPIDKMEPSHLQSAFLSLNEREYDIFTEINDLYKKLNSITLLKSKLRRSADKRAIKLIYPDQKYPHAKKWGIYFEAERKTNAMRPEKAILSQT